MRRLVALAVVAILIGIQVGGQSNQQRIPGFHVEEELWPPKGVEDGRFGSALSTDGTRIAIGAPGEGDGAVYVYIRQSDAFVLEQRIDATRGPGFGSALVIQGDRLYVGVPDASAGLLTQTSGGIEIFERSSSWHHDASWDCPAPRAQARCGEALAVSGNRLYVGEPGPVVQDLVPGRVHMLDAETLSVVRTQEEPDANGLRFGAAIDVDGDHIVVGAPARVATDNVIPGGAFFYERHGTNWLPGDSYRADQNLNAAETFGQNVAIDHPDALVTTVTSNDVDAGVYFGGDAFFYEHDGSSWDLFDRETTELQAMALHNGTAVIGWFADYIFVYTKQATHWDWSGILGGWHFNSDADYGFALAYEDRMLAIGSPGATDRVQSGAAYAYYDNWKPWAYAGQDRRIDDLDRDGKETVTLDGSGSWDRDGQIVAYRWYVDDTYAGSGETLDVSMELGNHTVRLEVEDDVGATDQDWLRVRIRTPTTEADFIWSPEWIHYWSSAHFIDLSSDQRAPIKQWAWDFDGDGHTDSTRQNPSHHFGLGGTYDVTLTTTNMNGQTLKATRAVQVQDSPPTAFGGWSRVIPLEEPAMLSATTWLDGSGSTDDTGITSWSWSSSTQNLGDEERVEATFSRGAHYVSLEVRDEAWQWDRHSFTVLALPPDANETAVNRPSPDFDYQNNWNRFYEFWSDTDGSIAIAQWDFDGDGQIDDEGTYTWHQFDAPGEHDVTLTVINEEGAKETKTKKVLVKNEPPEARFWPDQAVVPLDTYLVFRGPGRDEAPLASWSWSFSDGSTGSTTDLGHVFSRLGNVTVALEVTDDGGLSASHEGTVEVVTLAEWEARFGTFQPDVLANATEEDAPAALGTPDAPGAPRFTATETYDPPVVQEASDEDAPRDPRDIKVLGIPAWIPALLLLLLIAAVLIIIPMRRR